MVILAIFPTKVGGKSVRYRDNQNYLAESTELLISQHEKKSKFTQKIHTEPLFSPENIVLLCTFVGAREQV
jgi:hypothetical protein